MKKKLAEVYDQNPTENNSKLFPFVLVTLYIKKLFFCKKRSSCEKVLHYNEQALRDLYRMFDHKVLFVSAKTDPSLGSPVLLWDSKR